MTLKGQIKVILLKNMVFVRDNAIVNMEHVIANHGSRIRMCIISLTFGDLETSDQGHLLEKQGFRAR